MRSLSIGIFLVLLGLFIPHISWSAGLWLYELATPDMGTAGAGRAAMATDASTAGSNPAGMTRLDRSQILIGLEGLYVNSRFDLESSTYGGGDGGNAGGLVPAGSFSYVHTVSDDCKLGFTFGSNFGLGVDYGDSWAGRYYATEAEFVTVGLNPSVGYRVNDWMSIGAGVDILYSQLTQKVAIQNAFDPDGDGELKIEDDDVSYGYNLGLLFEPRADTRIGITYRSELEVEFKDVASLTNIGPVLQSLLNVTGLYSSTVDLNMTVPQAVMVSGYHQLNSQWAIVGNVGWQDWSAFGKQNLTLAAAESQTFTKDLGYEDTWHVALGAQYRFAKQWLWSVGAAYDSSPVEDDDTRTPDLPLDRQIRVGTGLQYDWNEDITVGAAYEYLDAGNADINLDGGPLQGDLKGDYGTNAIHFLAVNLIWRL